MTILVVEDNPDISDLISKTLQNTGQEISVVNDGELGLIAGASGAFDLILLDAMLPVFSGFEVCQRLRESGVTVPIVMLTCRDSQADMLRGLRLGADDYITKPFSTAELSARIAAHLRRQKDYKQNKNLVIGSLSLNPSRRIVHSDNNIIELTKREFDLLHSLMQSRGDAVLRDSLLGDVWGTKKSILQVLSMYM
ncbi:response regulator ArlR [Roseibium sp. TrichSKD4]|nr:response regulator transcription factor [Roseibium sp. TrichSKD4]EFO32936.1 response regulator ArlR [Roseibium sp. TrichSKD4]